MDGRIEARWGLSPEFFFPDRDADQVLSAIKVQTLLKYMCH